MKRNTISLPPASRTSLAEFLFLCNLRRDYADRLTVKRISAAMGCSQDNVYRYLAARRADLAGYVLLAETMLRLAPLDAAAYRRRMDGPNGLGQRVCDAIRRAAAADRNADRNAAGNANGTAN